ncbi:condensation domain-containing protein [Streptomyces stramineus]
MLLTHHIASDGSSVGPLARDLSTAYAARRAGTAPDWAPLPVQYADYTLWQREVLGDENDPASLISGQTDYWREALAGLPEQLELPADRARPAVADHRGAHVAFSWDAGLHDAVTRLARARQASVFMVVQAAVAALLTRLGAGTDIPLGTPVAGRSDDGLDDLVGFFVNTLVLRTDTSGNPSFAELVDRVRETDLAAFAHQDVPFERLVEIVNPTRSLAYHPLFQVAISLDGVSDGELDLPGLAVEGMGVDTGVAKVDLAFNLEERFGDDGAAAGVHGVVEFATALFDRATAEAVSARLERLLRAAVADVSVPIGELEVLSADERHELLAGWNDTAREVPAATFPELFQAQAARTPDAPALEYGDTVLTYGELNARANRLAHHLIAQGVGPEGVVALALPRSAELVVSILAVLKAGGAYLPVDPEYPADRVAHMLDDARPVHLVTTLASRNLPAGTVPLVLDDPATVRTLAGRPAGNPADADRTAPLVPAHPAYVIYTSGSTGRPKGVVVSHRGVANLSAHQRVRLGAGPASRVSQLVSPASTCRWPSCAWAC